MPEKSLARRIERAEAQGRATQDAFVKTLTDDEIRGLVEFIARDTERADLTWRGDPVVEGQFLRAFAVINSLPCEAWIGPFRHAEARAACVQLLDTVRERGFKTWAEARRTA